MAIYAFIDGQNLIKGVEEQGWKLGYEKFRWYLKHKYVVEKAFWFVGYAEQYQRIYDRLSRSGFDLIFKPTMPVKKGNKWELKGNVDAEVVLHAMINYEKYDKAVLVANDGDYLCLAKHLMENKKLKIMISPNRAKTSGFLTSARIPLSYVDDLRHILEL
ncbi:MAG: hypothetical protein A2V52_03495 [Actinobacteria bacterium RBG_19FT_COMBO_54_7]|uniref:NYN domain-containing protein n=1 Tax=Candidatus Solincola sediminis TaxID=1797199 RepID=A0A1F2WQF8_9ACTN|nr:MAG: hypothetical protein A2Y75_00730 [Candidatus Solincola sediminis]OFW61447.1 MAG: hypothetical protein A2W01_09710 [Candidatus Solincola sediminis]OFW66818.1 MAG: hypothetical protein A2V52_03495 [Actinobacteria bacterium RBG_19FT_COMBO_54_7]